MDRPNFEQTGQNKTIYTHQNLDRPIFTQSEQLILDTVRDLVKDIKKISEDVSSMRLCHLENKNDIEKVRDRLDEHIKDHRRFSTPIINWILGGGFTMLIFWIIKYHKAA